jgi:hypothetical protein
MHAYRSARLKIVGVAGLGPARTVLPATGGPLGPKPSASTSSATPRMPLSVCPLRDRGCNPGP